ncbi:MAG: DNA polymerase Y family protein [Chloroflexi bacterium]|nr:DNA polymerase Y family protein [Chloroflexota bacterium]
MDSNLRIACLLIPHFVVGLERQRATDLKGMPVVVVSPGSKGETVLDASEEASGVMPGMSLVMALSRFPEAAVIPASMPRYEEAWSRMLDLMETLSPTVENGGFGCAYADSKGLAALHGGVDRMASAWLAALSECWDARLSMAPSKFPAYMAATRLAPGQHAVVTEDVAAYMASFPVEVLPLSFKEIAALRSFGLHSLGDIAPLPVGALAAQFGPRGRLAWELANGIDRRPLVPRKSQVTVKETMDLPAPATTIETVLMAVESLLGRTFSRKELRGRCARVALFEADISGASSFIKRVTFKEPVASKEQAFSVLKKLLADISLPGPIEALSLTLSGIGGEAGKQASLFIEVRRRDNLREAIRELKARFAGEAPLYQVREVEPWSRIPERRRALVPYAP